MKNKKGLYILAVCVFAFALFVLFRNNTHSFKRLSASVTPEEEKNLIIEKAEKYINDNIDQYDGKSEIRVKDLIINNYLNEEEAKDVTKDLYEEEKDILWRLISSWIIYEKQSKNEMGNDITITEQFIGRNPIPVYLDYQYNEKLKPTVTLVKNNCNNSSDYCLSEFDIRHILRLITGQHGYMWMKVDTDDVSEDTWYKVKVTSTALLKVSLDRIIGLKINMECDSQFGYSPIQTIKISENAFSKFYIYNNTDDIYTYLLPKVEIKILEEGNLELKNDDEDWSTIINNLSIGEVITMDSEKQIITSSINHKTALINDFNLHWVRLISGMNEYTANLNCEIIFSFRLRRKGGFLCS